MEVVTEKTLPLMSPRVCSAGVWEASRDADRQAWDLTFGVSRRQREKNTMHIVASPGLKRVFKCVCVCVRGCARGIL